MYLEATDPDYLDVINDGPYMPTKPVPATPTVAEHYQLRVKSEVITYKTAKEIWDAIKKNRRAVPIQEYEHFEAKPDESLTDIYDRFLTLLNNLSLGGKERKSNKGKSVALKVNDKASKEKYVGVVRKKNNFPESNTDDSSSNPDDDTNSETDENMTDSGIIKKFTGGERKSTGRRDGKDSKAGKVDRTKIKCYNCDEPGHFAIECKKTKHDKGKNKALITSNKNWMDSSDSENEDTCYALMASLDDPASSEFEVPTFFFFFDTEDISELKFILKSLHGNFKNKTLENDRLVTEIEILKSRNVQLESDLVNQIDLKKECERAKHTVKILEPRYNMFEKDLENERKTFKAWNDSGKKTPVKFISTEANEPESIFEKGSTSVSQEKLGNKKNTLILDSRCSGHMTGNKSLLSEFEKKAGPDVSYGDGNVGYTLGYGNLIIEKVAIENVALVDGLKHNLLSISQITDRGYHVVFYDSHCKVVHNKSKEIVLIGYMHDESWNWLKKLSHLNFNSINELVKKDLVRGLPNMLYSSDGLCDACQKSKQRRVSFKSKTEFSISEPYHMLHLDLFGPVNIMSINMKRKDETPEILLDHTRQIENGSTHKVKTLRSDNGTEFKNSKMEEFCKYKGIEQQFSAPGTPQQNGVVERKNITLIEAGRTLLEEAKLPTYFWAEVVNTTCYTQNITLINRHGVTPYQMLKERKPSLKHLHVFGCKCFVLRTHTDQLGKFESKADEGIFVGYSPSRTYRVFCYDRHFM
ncbi:hypothetical protein AgCh_008446 [Apium graveolens]